MLNNEKPYFKTRPKNNNKKSRAPESKSPFISGL